jgi:type III secretory pathway component EscV
MDELIHEAMRFIPQSRVAETVRRWLPHQNGLRDDRMR